MKKIFLTIGTILVMCLALFIGAKALNPVKSTSANNVVNIFNWGDYLDPSLIKKFEKETGYKVVYESFDSNEAMFTKIKQGGTKYDITIPSDYMIEKMKKAHLLEKIDQKKLSNFNQIDPQFLHKSFDPKNEYSVPYFWGTLGIVYNKKMVNSTHLEHFNDLWRPEFKKNILLVDSARDMMGMSLVSLGYSMNSTDSVQLKLAQTKLDELSKNVKAIVADEMKMYLVQEEAAIGVTWSGEAFEMLGQNKNLAYFVPNEGSNLWFDNMVIPKTAHNKKGAYAFINFMLDPKNAAQNAEYIGYATPIKKAKMMLPKSVQDNQAFYPPNSTMKKLEVYRDLPSTIVQEYNDLFLEFKMFNR